MIRRSRTTGHLWQGRFGSVAMDEAHLAETDDAVVRVKPALERVGAFAAFLATEVDEDAAFAPLRRAETIGRPIGDAEWITLIEERTGRKLAPGKRGPPKRTLETRK